MEAKGATFYAGNVPIFYFPYYRRRLDQPPNHWSLTPGYRSRYGMFLEGSYNWNLSDRLNGVAHLDYRSLRGFAGGLDVDYDLGFLGQGDASVYKKGLKTRNLICVLQVACRGWIGRRRRRRALASSIDALLARKSKIEEDIEEAEARLALAEEVGSFLVRHVRMIYIISFVGTFKHKILYILSFIIFFVGEALFFHALVVSRDILSS